MTWTPVVKTKTGESIAMCPDCRHMKRRIAFAKTEWIAALSRARLPWWKRFGTTHNERQDHERTLFVEYCDTMESMQWHLRQHFIDDGVIDLENQGTKRPAGV